MAFYTIRHCGDYARPVELDQVELGYVFEKDGKHYIKSSYEFMGDFHEDDVLLYESKKEAWRAVLRQIDDHIKDMQVKRDEMYKLAIKDTQEDVNKSMVGFLQQSTDLFAKRNVVQ
jgi:hypothetical protein